MAAWKRNRIIRRLIEQQHDMPDRRTLEQLREVWDGGGSADVDLVQDMCRRAKDADRPILECGSGMTTLLLGIYSSMPVLALEDSLAWTKRIRAAIRWYGLGDTVVVAHCPLVRWQNFTWYDVSGAPLSDAYSLVVCDGPIGERDPDQLSRYGLVPAMGERIADATILLDDVERAAEQKTLRLWQKHGRSYRIEDPATRSYAVVD